MSTTTLMDPLEAHMLDAGDANIYIGSLSTDTWPTADVTMTDDTSSDHQTMDVDMDHRDGELMDYEVDEEEQGRDEEMMDADFVDAVNQQSPSLIAIDEPQLLSVTASPHMNGALPTSFSTPVMLDFDLEPAESIVHPPQAADHAIASDAPAFLSTSDVVEARSPHLNQAEVVVADAAETASRSSTVDALSDHPAVPTTRHTSLPGEDRGDELQGHPQEAMKRETEVAEPVDLGAYLDDSHDVEEEAGNSGYLGDEYPDDANNIPVRPIDSIDASVEQEVEAVALHEGSASQNGYENEHSTVKAGGSGDPHEISEGIYIDPPPPVLLSVCLSSEPVECCLFNQPTLYSRSQSPSSRTASSGQQVLTLLLHHRPTLYYEPLSCVFDALRQDGYIHSLLQYEDGELVLDASDLQLVISEDNMHTHEVTLHDLDVIHDGSDLTGPLHLHLRLVSPRFITRYNALRDQIEQLNIGEDDSWHYDKSHEATVANLEEQGNIADSQLAVAHSTEEVDGHIEEHYNGVDEEENLDEAIAYPDIERQVHLEASEDSASDYQEEREATLAGDQQPVDDLDADVVHHDADAEAGEYEEHADYAEDDDKRFGEYLPHELGGTTDAVGEEELYSNEPAAENVLRASEEVHAATSDDNSDLHPGEIAHGNADTTAPTHAAINEPASTDISAPAYKHSAPKEYSVEDFDPIEYPEDDLDDMPADHVTHSVDGSSLSNGIHGTDIFDVVFEDYIDPDDPEDAAAIYASQVLKKGPSPPATKPLKRAHDQVDSEDDFDGHDASPPSSPGSKRLKVQ